MTGPGFRQYPMIRWLGPQGPVELVGELRYYARDGRVFVAPSGLVSDLESRPTVLPIVVNWLLGTTLSTACAALIHDAGYGRTLLVIPAGALPGATPRPAAPPLERWELDVLYREILDVTSTLPPAKTWRETAARPFRLSYNFARRWVAWTGLKLGGWKAWDEGAEEAAS